MSVGYVGMMYEDTGPLALAAPGKRSNGGLPFFVFGSPLSSGAPAAAPPFVR
jgi:hypothetical protein